FSPGSAPSGASWRAAQHHDQCTHASPLSGSGADIARLLSNVRFERDCVAKVFLAFGRETLIQDRARTSNNDSKEPTLRFDCYKFLFHRAGLATFATQSEEKRTWLAGSKCKIGQLRHTHAIDTCRQPTARACHRRHFRRCGSLHQYRGAAGASSTRPWRPAYAMEAQLRAWIDHAILARDHLGCARCTGLFWHLVLALAPCRGADPRHLALYARGGSSGQQAPGGNIAGIRERRDARPGVYLGLTCF